MADKIILDPVTRLEGHLRLETSVEGGVVTGAWSTGTLFRGVEMILRDRFPLDAHMITQRICGVCTYVHAAASVRCVENSLGIAIPELARMYRNLMMGAQFIYDHIMHFYHLHALDWVNVPSALTASATAAVAADASINPARGRNAAYFSGVLSKLGTFASRGQLGPFGNGYWDHPGYTLPAAQNLVLVADYLEALNIQKEIARIQTLLGGRNPHPHSILVGGILQSFNDMNGPSAIVSPVTLAEPLCATAKNFVDTYYYPDVVALAKAYPESWNSGGFANLLCVGEFPAANGIPFLPGGVITGGYPGTLNEVNEAEITEDVSRSWYAGADGLQPANGVTVPDYTGIDTSEKYSWLKSPRYQGLPMEVGPLARVMVAYRKNVTSVQTVVNDFLAKTGMNLSQMHSTMGRIAARAIETKVIADQMPGWIDALQLIFPQYWWDPIPHNRSYYYTGPLPPATGYSFTEAPRGALGHWINHQNNKIVNYQMVVPSTWNMSPRDAVGVPGPVEQALEGLPVADQSMPLEILRVIHSFDPCLACAVHVLDMTAKEESGIVFR